MAPSLQITSKERSAKSRSPHVRDPGLHPVREPKAQHFAIQKVDKRRMIVDGHDPRGRALREHQSLGTGATTDVEHASPRSDARNEREGPTRTRGFSRSLPGQPAEELEEQFGHSASTGAGRGAEAVGRQVEHSADLARYARVSPTSASASRTEGHGVGQREASIWYSSASAANDTVRFRSDDLLPPSSTRARMRNRGPRHPPLTCAFLLGTPPPGWRDLSLWAQDCRT